MGNSADRIVLVVIILLIGYSGFRYAYFIKYEHFVCAKCGYKFKPKVWKLIFSQNAVDGKIMKCSNCKKTVFLPPVKDRGKEPEDK